VQREYTGLGMLTKEYQSHSGAVITGTTPKVQYLWNDLENMARALST